MPRLAHILFLCLFFLCSCQKEAVKYELSEELLTKVIVDIHISEAAVQHLSLEMKDSMTRIYYGQILEIHEVDQQSFEKDFQQLKRDPEKLMAVYDKVIEQLNELRTQKKDR